MKKSELLNTNCGSYVYSAPEVLEGAQYEGVQADIWSMGKGSVHIHVYDQCVPQIEFLFRD